MPRSEHNRMLHFFLAWASAADRSDKRTSSCQNIIRFSWSKFPFLISVCLHKDRQWWLPVSRPGVIPLNSPIAKSKKAERVQGTTHTCAAVTHCLVFFLFGGDDPGPQSAAKCGRQFEVLLLSFEWQLGDPLVGSCCTAERREQAAKKHFKTWNVINWPCADRHGDGIYRRALFEKKLRFDFSLVVVAEIIDPVASGFVCHINWLWFILCVIKQHWFCFSGWTMRLSDPWLCCALVFAARSQPANFFLWACFALISKHAAGRQVKPRECACVCLHVQSHAAGVCQCACMRVWLCAISFNL